MSRQGKTWGVKNGWGAKDAEWDTGNSWDKTDKSDWGIGNTNGYHVDAHDPMAQSVALVKKYITKVINGENKWDVSTCELLEFSVDNSLKRPKHARNRLQRNLVAEIKAGLEKYKDTLETKQDDAQRLYEQFQEDCDTADEHLEALTSEIKEIEAQKIGAEETVQREYELMMALKGKEDEAQDEVHAVQQKTKELNAQVARTAYVYEREFLCMKKDYRTHGRVEKITQQLEKLGAEEALVKCIDVSLQLAERGDLAMAAIALAEKVFAEKLEELKKKQTAIETSDLPKAQQRVDESMRSVEEQREKVSQCSRMLDGINEILDDKMQKKEKCEQCISFPFAYHKDLQTALEAAEDKVAKFAECEDAVQYIEDNSAEIHSRSLIAQ